jgi:hypothetical protein
MNTEIKAELTEFAITQNEIMGKVQVEFAPPWLRDFMTERVTFEAPKGWEETCGPDVLGPGPTAEFGRKGSTIDVVYFPEWHTYAINATIIFEERYFGSGKQTKMRMYDDVRAESKEEAQEIINDFAKKVNAARSEFYRKKMRKAA